MDDAAARLYWSPREFAQAVATDGFEGEVDEDSVFDYTFTRADGTEEGNTTAKYLHE